ncbi:hypothetical protein D3C86_1253780 [compost metagenome]
MRITFCQLLQVNMFDHLGSAAAGFHLRQSAKTEHDILLDGEMRKQRVILKDKTDIALFRLHENSGAGNDSAVQGNAAMIRRLHARHNAQQGRFSTAGAPHQTNDFATFDGKIDIGQHVRIAESFPNRFQFKRCPACHFQSCPALRIMLIAQIRIKVKKAGKNVFPFTSWRDVRQQY